jgi:hypothetical protein
LLIGAPLSVRTPGWPDGRSTLSPSAVAKSKCPRRLVLTRVDPIEALSQKKGSLLIGYRTFAAGDRASLGALCRTSRGEHEKPRPVCLASRRFGEDQAAPSLEGA